MIRTTDAGPAPWRAEAAVGVLVWVVFTALVAAVAPLLVRLPLPVTAAFVLPACIVIGWAIGRTFARVRPGPCCSAAILLRCSARPPPTAGRVSREPDDEYDDGRPTAQRHPARQPDALLTYLILILYRA